MLTTQAKDWLKSRGISENTAASLQLESAQPRTGEGEWIAFPYFIGGERVNTKYRRIDAKAFYQDGGAEKVCYNFDAISEPEFDGPVIICEGELDVCAAIEAGFNRVVSVPDGAPNEEIGDRDSKKYSYIPALVEALRNEKSPIIIAADGDHNGQNLRNDLARRLGKARCKFLEYPKECKDLNDALIKYDVKGVTATIERAKFVEMHGIVQLHQLPPADDPVVYRAGLSYDFDKHVGICKKHFSVWTGIPNHGKSAAIKAVSVELAKQYGWKIAAAVFEDEPQSDFRRDIAKYVSGKSLKEMVRDDWNAADEFLKRHYWFMIPDFDDEVTLDWLLERMERAVIERGVDMIIIDPWTELDHEFGDLSETQYTSICIKQMRRFARKFDVHVALVAHPKKIEADKQGNVRAPGGYDISGSAHFNNKPELGITVHRERSLGEDVCVMRVWKSKRHDIMGKTGDVMLRFNYLTGRYSDYYGG
jgi:twinkle protein